MSEKTKTILGWIRALARAQGFYGRLLKYFEEMGPEQTEAALSRFHGCKDCVDFSMAIESGM